jgi:hypothetical protein
MSRDDEQKQVYSVTELAALLGLSRTRVYQLLREGVLPFPLYCTYTRRPFYSAEQVEKCLTIRKTGRALNGRVVIFYQHRGGNGQRQRPDGDEKREEFYMAVMRFVKKHLGEKLTRSEVKRIISALYPDGLTEHEINEEVANAVVQYLYRGGKISVQPVSKDRKKGVKDASNSRPHVDTFGAQ